METSVKKGVESSTGYVREIMFRCPPSVLSRLDSFAKENSGDCYWLAVQQLLDFFDEKNSVDTKTVLLMERDDLLRDDIDRLRSEFDAFKSELEKAKDKPKVSKHFG